MSPVAKAPAAPRTAKSSPKAAETDAAPKPKRVRKPKAAPLDIEALQALILTRLDDDKAEDVVAIDLKGKSPLADTIVVASGRSQRHVAAMADHLVRAIKENGYGRAKTEGLPQADWVLIDAGDIIVHLFRPEVRAFYQIEKIWSVEPGQSGHMVSTT